MSFQPSVDSFGIRLLEFKCSWWHPRNANDAIASERSIFSKNDDYIYFWDLHVFSKNDDYIYFWDLHAHGGRKLLTDTHIHTYTGQLQ